jgi:hypothetical protein
LKLQVDVGYIKIVEEYFSVRQLVDVEQSANQIQNGQSFAQVAAYVFFAID